MWLRRAVILTKSCFIEATVLNHINRRTVPLVQGCQT